MKKVLKFLQLENYNRYLLTEDLKTSLTVAVVAIPQSMAYAMIAGLNPVYGLYTSIVTVIIGSLLGSSNYLINGATNTMSILVAGVFAGMSGTEDPLAILFLVTFLAGVLQFLFGVLKLGNVVDFISHSVMVGFMTGAGVIIAMGQFYKTLGLKLGEGHHSPVNKVIFAFSHLGEINLYALGLAVLTIVIIIGAKKIDRRLPGPLLSILITGGLAALFKLDAKGVYLTGDIPQGLPDFLAVKFRLDWITEFAPDALAIAIIGLVESCSIARSMAQESDEKLNANREFMAQGVQNMVGSHFQCFPAAGSFTRSALNYYNGAKSRMSGIFTGVFTAVIFVFFGRYASWIPSASLAAIIMLTAFNLLKIEDMKKAFALSRGEGLVALITMVGTIVLPELTWAVYTGVIVSFVVYFKNSSEVRVKLLSEIDGTLEERSLKEANEHSRYMIIQLEGSLYFGNTNDLETKLSSLIGKSQVFIIRFKRVSSIDLTCVEAIHRFMTKVESQGGEVIFCGVSNGLGETLIESKLLHGVNKEDVFFSGDQLHQSTRSAIEKAKAILSA